MTDIDILFFELIRAAIGIQNGLYRQPSVQEWHTLYKMAEKQSLLGICLSGLQNLGANVDEGFARIGIPDEVFFQWVGMAVQIQQRNEVVNRQCVDLQIRFSDAGMETCILKGQGVCPLYGSQLSVLRQSGDIDVWVKNRSIEELVDYCKRFGVRFKATAAHVECELFEGTKVELHSAPAFMRFYFADRKFGKWFRQYKDVDFPEVNGIVVPHIEFNLVYMMVHMYHHVLFEGLGLRQVMDYYFVLKTCVDDSVKASSVNTINDLGMYKFASGIMWILKEVFCMADTMLLCNPNEKTGRLLLDEMIRGGNFGHYDENKKYQHGGTVVGRSLKRLKRNMKFFALGPWEVLCSPLWSTWHYVWRKRMGFK